MAIAVAEPSPHMHEAQTKRRGRDQLRQKSQGESGEDRPQQCPPSGKLKRMNTWGQGVATK